MAQSTASSSLCSTQYDDSSDDGQGPSTKRKRYSCMFKKHLSKTFPWATESKRGRSFAFCVRCNRDISMGQGSVKDLSGTSRLLYTHEQRNPASELLPLSSYFGPVRHEAAIEAEVKFGYFLGEHHLI